MAATTSPSPVSAVAVPPTATPSPSPTAGSPDASAATFPLALVATGTDLRLGYSITAVSALLAAGTVLLPCGVEAIALAGSPIGAPPTAAPCTDATAMTALLKAKKGSLGLLPAGMVDPRVKALTVGGADLFGGTVERARAWPLVGRRTPDSRLTDAEVAYAVDDIRTIVSTGDTCPDRAPALYALKKGKGWDWTLKGGTVKYTGSSVDRHFVGPYQGGYQVMIAKRTGTGAGAVWSLIRHADIAVNDFECPMIRNFTFHEHGTFFTIDPAVAKLMADVGMDVASLGSNHIMDLGADGLRQTLAYLRAAGVQYAGAGMNADQASTPAIVEVRGVRFAILSGDATGTSSVATSTRAGVMRPTAASVAAAVAKARAAGAQVIVLMPQWNWPEYSAPFSATALRQRETWYRLGVDHILGSGTHWASAMSITQPDPAKGWRLAVTSHGNFLFGQLWSRQTEEGVIYEVTFRGTQLVQVRLHPYFVMDGAQPSLINPVTDGAFVQRQVFGVSQLP